MEERIAMAANAEELYVEIWENRSKVTWDERGKKNANSSSSGGVAFGVYADVPHEEKNPHQTVFRSRSALLPEEGQHNPIDQQGEAKGASDCDGSSFPLSRVQSVHRVTSEHPNGTAYHRCQDNVI